jgi:hypothetical protein
MTPASRVGERAGTRVGARGGDWEAIRERGATLARAYARKHASTPREFVAVARDYWRAFLDFAVIALREVWGRVLTFAEIERGRW